MKFRTAYERERKISPSGSRYRKNYVKSYEKDGTPVLQEAGVEDVYDSIQKAGQGLGIEDLIRRARAGDDTAIREPVDSYVDLTHAPKDMLEAHQMLVEAKDKYLQLPAELRGKFGNSFDQFLKASADGSALKVLQPNKQSEPVQPLSTSEVAAIRKMIGGNDNA